MSEQNVNQQPRMIDTDLRSDLDHFEDIYRYLLRTTTQLYERKFQLGLTIFMAITLLLITFIAPHEWYSYVLCVCALAGLWYLFYSTDAVRVAVGAVPQSGPLLEQMKMRKIVIDRIADLRMRTSIQSALVLIVVLSFRPPYLWNGGMGIIVVTLVLVMILVSVVFYVRKIAAARKYLSSILDALGG